MTTMYQDPLARTYDAVVIGSGATGGWAAKRLSEAGLKVALLEAGRKISPDEFTEHMPAYKLEFRNLTPEMVRTMAQIGRRSVSSLDATCLMTADRW